MLRTARTFTVLAIAAAGCACAGGRNVTPATTHAAPTVLVGSEARVPAECTELAVIVAEEGDDAGTCDGAVARLVHLGSIHGADAVVLLEHGTAVTGEAARAGRYFARGRLLSCTGSARPGPSIERAAACAGAAAVTR